MSKKNKKKIKPQAAVLGESDWLEKAQAAEYAGKLRQARDAYKELYRLNSQKYSAEYCRVLSAFARSLESQGMLEQAQQIRANAQRVLETLDSSSENNTLESLLPRFQLSMDMYQWSGVVAHVRQLLTLPEAQAQLSDQARRLLSDACVLVQEVPAEWKQLASVLPEAWIHECTLISQAIDALDQADWEGCTAALHPIPRQSIFAEWKLCLKGILSFHNKEYARAETAFAKLHKSCAPAKLAREYLRWIELLSDTHPVVDCRKDTIEQWILSTYLEPKDAENIQTISGYLAVQDFSKAWAIVKSQQNIPAYDDSLAGVFTFYLIKVIYAHRKSSLHDMEVLLDYQLEDHNNDRRFFFQSLLVLQALCHVAKRDSWGILDVFFEVEKGRDYIDELVIVYGRSEYLDVAWVAYMLEHLAMEIADNTQNQAHPDVLRLLQRAVQIAPEDPELWIGLYRVFDASKLFSERNKCIDQASEKFPNHKHIQQFAAVCAFNRNAFTKAVKFYKKMTEADRFDASAQQGYVHSQIAIAEAHYCKRSYKKGAAIYEELIAEAPKDSQNCSYGKQYLQARFAALQYWYEDAETCPIEASSTEDALWNSSVVADLMRAFVISENYSLSITKARDQLKDKKNKRMPLCSLKPKVAAKQCIEQATPALLGLVVKLINTYAEKWRHFIPNHAPSETCLHALRDFLKAVFAELPVSDSQVGNSQEQMIKLWREITEIEELRFSVLDAVLKRYPNALDVKLYAIKHNLKTIPKSLLPGLTAMLQTQVLEQLDDLKVKINKHSAYAYLIPEAEALTLQIERCIEMARMQALDMLDEGDEDDYDDDDFTEDDAILNSLDFDEIHECFVKNIHKISEFTQEVQQHEYKILQNLQSNFSRVIKRTDEKAYSAWIKSLTEKDFCLLMRSLYSEQMIEIMSQLLISRAGILGNPVSFLDYLDRCGFFDSASNPASKNEKKSNASPAPKPPPPPSPPPKAPKSSLPKPDLPGQMTLF